MPESENIDCIEVKRQAQRELVKALAGHSPQEQVEIIKKMAAESPFCQRLGKAKRKPAPRATKAATKQRKTG